MTSPSGLVRSINFLFGPTRDRLAVASCRSSFPPIPSMHLLNAAWLADELREGELSEKQKLAHLVAMAAVGLLFVARAAGVDG